MTAKRPGVLEVKVQLVFDPDGNGGDFAYTVGLASLGLPELHVWARPSEGTDPADDWMLSHHDLAAVLGEFAERAAKGNLAVGDRIVKLVDEGLAELEFRVHPAVDPQQVDAYGIAEGATVLPLRWSLHRQAEGPSSPVDDAMARQIAHKISRERVALPDRLPVEWQPADGPPDFRPDQRYGPLTPLVVAHGGQFARMSVRAFTTFSENVLAVVIADVHLPSYSAVLRASARPVGRTFALDALDEPVDRLVDAWQHQLASNRLWQLFHARVAAAYGYSESELPEFTPRMFRYLRDAVRGHLAACVLWDVLPRKVRQAAHGPMMFAALEHATPQPWPIESHVDWSAPEELQRKISELLTDFTPDDLNRLTEICRLAQEVEEVGELNTRLLGWRLVGAATLDSAEDALQHIDPEVYSKLFEYDYDDAGDDREKREEREEIVAELLETSMAALHMLSSAVVHRERLGSTELVRLTDVFDVVLPGARQLFSGAA